MTSTRHLVTSAASACSCVHACMRARAGVRMGAVLSVIKISTELKNSNLNVSEVKTDPKAGVGVIMV